ncbi:protein cereblon-like [Hydractinia symbiolongicarpus]|uniref:protein cereblon-like n=1 Tax=Hydractinia symbiolongicarpus TaxID=13093 RepID=UPI002550B30D|nr:protein cereblon-like [Hydractinia symbiolongicarpus]
MSEENPETDEEEEEEVQAYVDVLQEFLAHGEVQDIDEEEDEEGVQIMDDTDNEEMQEEEGTNFDPSLPTSHSYMGADMEELHGRTVHADGEIVLLPLFFLPGVVLVPGQTLPLNLFHPQPISMMKRVIAADKTFGLMIARSQSFSRNDDERTSFASVGVTCEIYSVKESEEYGVGQLSIKAEGRQRFKILSKEMQMDGVIMGKIQILPDAYISPYPPSAQIFSQLHQPNAIRSQVVANKFYVHTHPWIFGESRYLAGFNRRTAKTLCTSLTSIQGWVYRLYDPYFLMDCLINEIHSWNQNLKFESLPKTPIEFSHWITANLPLTNEMKIELLEIDSASLRLRRQIEIMNKCATTLACDECGSIIADKNDLFSLSRKGPMAAYVNPGGHVHETVTFYKARNLSLSGRSSTEYSWFPGYAWTIASCRNCHSHMGWKFTAAKKGLSPTKFWGLTRASLTPVYKEVKVSGEDEIIHVNEEATSLEESTSREESTVNPVQYESSI